MTQASGFDQIMALVARGERLEAQLRDHIASAAAANTALAERLDASLARVDALERQLKVILDGRLSAIQRRLDLLEPIGPGSVMQAGRGGAGGNVTGSGQSGGGGAGGSVNLTLDGVPK